MLRPVNQELPTLNDLLGCLTNRVSARRIKPGGFPCLERISSHSPVKPTTLTLVPFGMVANFVEETEGSL